MSASSLARMPAGPTETDDDDVSGLELRGHGRFPSAQVLDASSARRSYCLLRYCSMWSAYMPMAPGNPIIFHTALLRLPPYIGSAKYPSMVFCSRMLKKVRDGHLREFRLSGFDRFERGRTIGRRNLVECLSAACLGAPGVEIGDADAVEISGRQRNLIALLRRAFAERTVEIHAGAAAISAGHFVIDEKGHADLDATGTDFIFGYQRVDECDDDCGLRRREVAENYRQLRRFVLVDECGRAASLALAPQ